MRIGQYLTRARELATDLYTRYYDPFLPEPPFPNSDNSHLDVVPRVASYHETPLNNRERKDLRHLKDVEKENKGLVASLCCALYEQVRHTYLLDRQINKQKEITRKMEADYQKLEERLESAYEKIQWLRGQTRRKQRLTTNIQHSQYPESGNQDMLDEASHINYLVEFLNGVTIHVTGGRKRIKNEVNDLRAKHNIDIRHYSPDESTNLRNAFTSSNGNTRIFVHVPERSSHELFQILRSRGIKPIYYNAARYPGGILEALLIQESEITGIPLGNVPVSSS